MRQAATRRNVVLDSSSDDEPRVIHTRSRDSNFVDLSASSTPTGSRRGKGTTRLHSQEGNVGGEAPRLPRKQDSEEQEWRESASEEAESVDGAEQGTVPKPWEGKGNWKISSQQLNHLGEIEFLLRNSDAKATGRRQFWVAKSLLEQRRPGLIELYDNDCTNTRAIGKRATRGAARKASSLLQRIAHEHDKRSDQDPSSESEISLRQKRRRTEDEEYKDESGSQARPHSSDEVEDEDQDPSSESEISLRQKRRRTKDEEYKDESGSQARPHSSDEVEDESGTQQPTHSSDENEQHQAEKLVTPKSHPPDRIGQTSSHRRASVRAQKLKEMRTVKQRNRLHNLKRVREESGFNSELIREKHDRRNSRIVQDNEEAEEYIDDDDGSEHARRRYKRNPSTRKTSKFNRKDEYSSEEASNDDIANFIVDDDEIDRGGKRSSEAENSDAVDEESGEEIQQTSSKKQLKRRRQKQIVDSDDELRGSSEDVIDGPALYWQVDYNREMESAMLGMGRQGGATMTVRQAFKVYVEVLCRANVEPRFVEQLRKNPQAGQNAQFSAAIRTIEGRLCSARDVFASMAWKLDFEAILSTRGFYQYFDLLRSEVNVCQVCGRSQHSAAYKVCLFGKEYNAKRVWEPGRWDLIFPEETLYYQRSPGSRTTSSSSSRPWWRHSSMLTRKDAQWFYMGKTCFGKTFKYHNLLHYKFRLAYKLSKKIEEQGGAFGPVLEDTELMNLEFNRYENMLKATNLDKSDKVSRQQYGGWSDGDEAPQRIQRWLRQQSQSDDEEEDEEGFNGHDMHTVAGAGLRHPHANPVRNYDNSLRNNEYGSSGDDLQIV